MSRARERQIEIDIIDILEGSYTVAGQRRWWDRSRPQLNGRTPSEAWMDGDIEEVYNLARGLLNGGGT